jgi:hypothetical protein
MTPDLVAVLDHFAPRGNGGVPEIRHAICMDKEE